MNAYPKLFIRIKAMLWDSIILSIFLVFMLLLSSQLGLENVYLQSAIVFIPVVSLEPLMVYFTGSSIGHRISGIKIGHLQQQKSLNLIQCYCRFIFKTLLGIYSFFSLLFTQKHQALHDIFCRTIVEFIEPDKAPANHKLSERSLVYTERKPSWVRRISIIITYLFLIYLTLSLSTLALVSANCIDLGYCSESENMLLTVLSLLLVFSAITIICLGAMCKLPGAYYQSKA